MRICVCATQVPFVTGGAELHVATLAEQLRARGFEVDVVTAPFAWTPQRQVLRSAFAWRMLALQEDPARPIDLVITTRFPTYLIQHPHKALWLIHQFRQVYDLLGTPFSDFDQSVEGRDIIRMVREMDTRAIAECQPRFTNAGNTAARLRRFNGLDAEPLYPPPPLDGRYRRGAFGDYVFTVGRLDPMKRVDVLIRALAHTRTPVRAKIAGSGPMRGELEQLVRDLGLGDRVELLGRVDDERLIELYAGCLGVFYGPFDEDYGYVTVEAFKSGKPVVTAPDSGGVLEFVDDGRTGLVAAAADLPGMAAHLDRLYEDRALAASLGEAGAALVGHIHWDHVIESLTGVARAEPGRR